MPFAVIKIRTVNINDKQRRELKFGGNGGTFIMLEYKDGEFWVYLTAKYAETVTIAAGDNKNLEITLPIDVATITITADDLTDVYVDDTLMKRGTWSGELYSGNHEIICKKQYFYDAKQTIIVEAGTPASYSLNINPIYGKMNITSEPMGATVYIDGNEYGVTPLEINGIIIGPHELKIEKGIWRTLKKQIVLEDGKILTLNETLENCPDGVINALFSVSSTQKVYFSKGNLQYQASTKTWRFAENQIRLGCL